MPVSCRVCFEPFSATSHPPRLLGCGHSFCSSCTDSLYAVSAYMVFCPVCRSRLSSRVVPPINYQLLGLQLVDKKRRRQVANKLWVE
ncbi:hypothetical protein Y032_0025g1181 [Ancylostoma ceylanicum]|uniref:RING-type domain-containing protein n=1 Tax=Ancylostoma ceylanicum TaxID=53326 RepID=A0A016UVU3_9BILA|nr:hypothetical protein Y032_0025g1181 [Ancylostoma ceylanicum]